VQAIVIVSDLALLIVVASALFGFTPTAAAEQIVTIAGTGTDGSAGDGSQATAAEIGEISAMAVDTQGNLYIADTWNQRVRMVSTAGVISTVAGSGVIGDSGDGGAAKSASLLWPNGVAVDANGNLYISTGSRVRKVSPDGTIAAFAGGTTPGYTGDGQAATGAQLSEPHGLAVDSAGNVYIADSGNFRIRMVGPNGVITSIAGTGQAGYAGDGGQARSAQIGYVHALALDSAGDLYFSDPYDHCVREVLASGAIATVAGGAFGGGGDGLAAGQAQFDYPYGVLVDGKGNLYVADLLNHRVRVMGGDGNVFTAAGIGQPGFNGDGEPGPYTALDMPAELALAPGGGIYIADLRNFRIRELRSPQVPPQPALDGTPGVFDAASYATSVAPGSLVTLFGRNLAYGAQSAGGYPLPAKMGETVVTLNGEPVPLLYASAGQINFQMPYADAGEASLGVAREGIATGPFNFQLALSAPGIFILAENQGAILNQDYGVNDPGRPAKHGSTVMIYATGAGTVAPVVPAGEVAPIGLPLSITPQNPTVTIGGIVAQVSFSGLAPGFAGLWQINAVVPQNAPAGDDIPVEVTLGSASNTVTMAIGR
jgi:uncharacterized protein (TIGR03437 family)